MYSTKNPVSNKLHVFISILFLAARVAIGEEKLMAKNLPEKINDSKVKGMSNNFVNLT